MSKVAKDNGSVIDNILGEASLECLCLEQVMKIINYAGDGVGSALVDSVLPDCHWEQATPTVTAVAGQNT